jgi:transcriptional antiterminator RfaH
MNEALTKAAWFCVRTLPKSEHIAAASLRVYEGVEVFCPLLRFRRMTRRGPVWFTEALFPGYIFSRFVPLESQRAVVAARGVNGIVRFGQKTPTVPEQTIAELQVHMNGEECKVIDPELRVGDSITIAAGVFRGLTTVVTQLIPARDRVRVLMELLGQCREVELSSNEIVPEFRHVLSR